MAQIKIGENPYSEEQLGNEGKQHLQAIRFIENKVVEIENMTAALNMAKNGYIKELKNNIIAAKAGLN